MARILLAAFFLSLCCFHYPAGSMMPQTTAYNQKFSCAPPRLDQPYSEALQGLLHFFQQQREQTWQWRCAIEKFWAICSLSRFTFSPHPVLFLAVREFWPIFICSAACIKRFAHSLSTSPSMILTRGGDSVTVPRDFLLPTDAQHEGWRGVEMSFGFWGLKFWGHQTVVFLRFKNDSSSDFSPLIQNKYDSRVFKMRY